MGKLVVVVKIREMLYKRKLTQLQLAEKAGMRQSYLSDMINDRRGVVNKSHLLNLYKALECKDIRELIDIVDSDELDDKDS